MPGYKLLYLASLVTFTFGALTFSVLAVVYWRERRPGRSPVFRAFTIVCALAFLINLARQFTVAESTALALALALTTGLLPPLLLHLVHAQEKPGGAWRWLPRAFYAFSVCAALANAFAESDLVENLPAVTLGAAGVLGLMVQSLSRRRPAPDERPLRKWYRILLSLTVAIAAANLVQPGPLVSLLPDYIVLAFFCVTLYHRERLVFFDLLIKRGAFFAVALVALTVFFGVERVPSGWTRPWVCALLLLPFWLMAPWIYSRLERAIDRAWLQRKYSPADAERQFVHEVQAAAGEQDLEERAARSLAGIFQAPAQVRFSGTSPEPAGGLAADLEGGGGVVLGPRPSSIPYLSDDRRLLQSLARTLGVVRDNVRFREREQRLRWLASRAELKALRAQINPHFLFNALNAIAGLIPGQPELADETIEQLAEVFRYTLRKSEQEWVPLDEEVEFVRAYLRVEQARFGDRLQTAFEIDPAAGAIEVPAMTIQPLIENAVKHGVSAMEGRATVGLCAAIDGDFLRVEVRDNGPGFPPGYQIRDGPPEHGHGLRNVLDRLTGYYGDSASLQLENGGGATRVTLKIPVPPAGREGHDTRPDRG